MPYLLKVSVAAHSPMLSVCGELRVPSGPSGVIIKVTGGAQNPLSDPNFTPVS